MTFYSHLISNLKILWCTKDLCPFIVERLLGALWNEKYVQNKFIWYC